ncbi:(2Fe-2S) ferredoxin domain-containing protein [Pseudonocardiaceae bacterium YIM PH 21723]|nr:(2Fe-2S) ferredoxin domain-containing protein [Pseudonocardiaceae bacterium YIM PH 21723]
MSRVTVCRGCCCGTVRKFPDVDHSAQLDRLRAELAGIAKIKVVDDCLGPCSDGNVIVVKPQGVKPIWVARVLTDQVVADLIDWIRSGAAEPPASVPVIPPYRKSR